MIRRLKSAGSLIMDLLYPDISACIYCGSENADAVSKLCADCAAEEEVQKLGRIEVKGYDCYAYMSFCELSRNAVHRLKYGEETWLAQKMGDKMFKLLNEKRAKFDTLTYVPLHKSRQRSRGYNQSEHLAERIAELYGIECEALLDRIRNTKSQTTQSAAGRIANVAGAFKLREGVDVRGRRIAIVDDIITTGATILECASVLEAAGAAEMILVCFAKPTPEEE